jgi:hypothetical protein
VNVTQNKEQYLALGANFLAVGAWGRWKKWCGIENKKGQSGMALV